ncbi:hypothetical protein F5X68DRAFT_187695 [Plectosphaerella plurivora]|uniref:Apple domain-containing protein n=1 Tax=Plectosphaerella plurivora TaxID=936078 RepID=A0A9P9AFR0_9PEZI|nr:hypothetical protein F5X68DRAFT_187695 [Plectosphaerella plurivora]
MKSAAVIVATLASAMASPLVARADQCNKAPTAAANANIKAISTPAAANAKACQDACNANSACKSFVFGLPAAASAPQCLLFDVPAAQVPPQQFTELFVFDKACAAASVPTVAPTHAAPRGTVAQTQQKKQQQPRAALSCNATPAGPQTAAAPIASPDAANSRACQDACNQNTRCQSFAFGLPTGATKPVCRLFEIAAPQVPALGNNLHVFDKACAASQVPNTTPTQGAPQGTVSGATPATGNGNNGAQNGQTGNGKANTNKGAAPKF